MFVKLKRETCFLGRPSGIAPFRHPERRETSYVRYRMPEQLRPEPKDLGEAATTMKFESRK